jgi:hypothetical protein
MGLVPRERIEERSRQGRREEQTGIGKEKTGKGKERGIKMSREGCRDG